VSLGKGGAMIHRISCTDMVLRLDDFVDRTLDTADLELVEEHLLEYVKCAEKFRFEASLVDGLREKLRHIAVPQHLLQTIQQRLELDRREG
jgi:hypothetical protein